MDAGPPIPATHTTGETVTRRHDREAVLLTAQDALTVTSYRLGPDQRGPAPHVHHEHTDAFYVLEGELSFILGPDREPVEVGAGGLVAAPPNVIHTFNNESGAEVRFLNLHSPDGGFAEYMRAIRDGVEGATFDTFDPPEDGGLPLSEAVVSRPGEGERLVAGERVSLLKSSLPDLCLAEFEIRPGYEGPGLHEHDAEVDSFYVLDGELDVLIEDDRHTAGPGTLAAIPPGVRHTFAHPGEGAVRFLNLHTPDSGFADFLRRVSD
jgi:mannose-6-phosphate isomerase-like protein (cupin superfamily)